MTVRIATRGSALAVWQAQHVANLLLAAGDATTVSLVTVETQGDQRKDAPIADLGGKGVFVKEVQAAVLEGRADIAVHSAKDLPSSTPGELVLVAVPERGDPRDALIGCDLTDLPEGGVVATGSLRRRAQLAHIRPDLRFAELRGNIATRLAKAVNFDAIVLAAVGLDRLGEAARIAQRLAPAQMLPQVGQGALAVECRKDDHDLRARLEKIEHRPSRRCVEAERGFLAQLGGDCSLPAAAHATCSGDSLTVEGMVAAVDGRKLLRHEVTGPTNAGAALGRSLAKHLLHDQGGAELLAPARELGER